MYPARNCIRMRVEYYIEFDVLEVVLIGIIKLLLSKYRKPR